MLYVDAVMWTGLSSRLIHALAAPQPTAALRATCVARTTPSHTCSPRLKGTRPHIMAATVAHHTGGQRFDLASVPAMVSAHSRCRACVWRPKPSRPHAQMAAASAHGAGGWRVHLNLARVCWGRRFAAAPLLSGCQYTCVWSWWVAWLAASAATWRLDPDPKPG